MQQNIHECLQLSAQSGCVQTTNTRVYLLFVGVHYSVFAFVCAVCYSFILQFCFVYTIGSVMYAYTICMFAPLRINLCVRVRVQKSVCVC